MKSITKKSLQFKENSIFDFTKEANKVQQALRTDNAHIATKVYFNMDEPTGPYHSINAIKANYENKTTLRGIEAKQFSKEFSPLEIISISYVPAAKINRPEDQPPLGITYWSKTQPQVITKTGINLGDNARLEFNKMSASSKYTIAAVERAKKILPF